MENSAYITLQNINPAQNKRRVYHITVTDFSVQLRWGRMDCHARQKVVTFQDEGEMLKFLKATLRRRELHGYRAADRSESFPKVEFLALLDKGFEPVQLSLF